MPRSILSHRHTVWLGVVGIGLLAVTVWAWTAVRSEPDSLGSYSVQAGAVEVEMTAMVLGATGARFGVVFDTHTVDLDFDPAEVSQLWIDGELAGPGSWSGDGPGGHHRTGDLTFTTPVPRGADVELRISGLPQDAVGTWTAP